MYFPTWIDLKGADAVPETVHHVVSVDLPLLLTWTDPRIVWTKLLQLRRWSNRIRISLMSTPYEQRHVHVYE